MKVVRTQKEINDKMWKICGSDTSFVFWYYDPAKKEYHCQYDYARAGRTLRKFVKWLTQKENGK